MLSVDRGLASDVAVALSWLGARAVLNVGFNRGPWSPGPAPARAPGTDVTAVGCNLPLGTAFGRANGDPRQGRTTRSWHRALSAL